VDDASQVLVHEFFHSRFKLPDEYKEGWPEPTDKGPMRTNERTCMSSIMCVLEVSELCVSGTHFSTPGSRQDPATPMWDLLAPRLSNVSAPTRSTTEFAPRSSKFRVPVDTSE
jgi:hypothetical protein